MDAAESVAGPTPKKRRWRRRAIGCLTIIAVVAAIGWFARLSVAEWTLQSLLPGQLSEALGGNAFVGEIELTRAPKSQRLRLRIDQVTVRLDGGVLDCRAIQVDFSSLGGAISDTLAAVQSAEIGIASWHAEGAPPATTAPQVPRVVLPAELPEVAFPILVQQWQLQTVSRTASGTASWIAGELQANATVQDTAVRATPDVPWGAALRAKISATEITDIRLRTQGWAGTGSLRRQPEGWRGVLDVVGDDGDAKVEFDLPIAADRPVHANITGTLGSSPPLSGVFELQSLAPNARLEGVVTTPSGTLAVTGTANATATDLMAEFVQFDPGPLLTPWLPDNYELTAPLNGELSWQLAASTTPTAAAEARIQARLRGAGPGRLTAPGVDESFTDLHVEGSYGQDGPRIEALRLSALNGAAQVGGSILPAPDGASQLVVATVRINEGSLALRGRVDREQLDLNVDCNGLDVGAVARHFAPGSPWSGVFEGSATLTGTYAEPLVNATLTSTDGALALAGERLSYRNLNASASYRQGAVALSQCRVEALGGVLAASGKIPFVGQREARADSNANATWDTNLTFTGIDVGALQPWTLIFRDLRGNLTGSASVTGTAATPAVEATCRLENGELAFEGWERLRDVAADLNYEDGELRFTNVSGRAGGGSLTGEGSWNARGPLAEITAQLQLERVILVRSPDLALRVTGELALSGNHESSALTGQLEVARGIYRRNYYPQLRGGATSSFDLFSLGGFFANTQWDIPLHLRGGFRIANNRVKITPYGTIRLRGTGAVPYLVGQVSASSGTLSLPHLQVDVGYAEFEFPENDPYRPQLRFQGTGSIRDHEITVDADGSLDDLEVEFRSQPELPEEQVLVLVATGRFPRDLSEGGVETTAATELALLYGPQVWEWIFGQSTGSVLEDITISTENANSADEVDRITVEWRLQDGVSVVGEQDHRGDVNVDVRFFWWFR